VVPFGLAATRRAVVSASEKAGLSGELRLRQSGGQPFVSDSGHYILDAAFGRIDDPEALAGSLARIPGVVEHGLFLDLASVAIIARASGIERLVRKQ
jgi:ribose 5-phosphate isomerase A